MRRHISVFGLWARCSLYKILTVIAVMVMVEYVLFYFNMEKEKKIYEVTQTFGRPENIIDRCGVFVCFAVAFLLITLMLSVYGCQFSSKTGYTLQRLRVSEKYVFLYKSIYNLLTYVLLWSVQVILCFFMLKLYAMQAPSELLGEQSLFLAFYRSTRLHPLLPLSDVMLWVRNAFLLISLSLCAAELPYLQRRGKKSFMAIALAMYTVALWKQDISPVGSLISTVLVTVVVFSSIVYQLFIKEDTDDVSEEVEY